MSVQGKEEISKSIQTEAIGGGIFVCIGCMGCAGISVNSAPDFAEITIG
jgi:hypothetical protein